MEDITAEFLRGTLRYEPTDGQFYWRVKPSRNVKVDDRTGSLSTNGYVQIRLRNRLYAAHRLAWLYVHGSWPCDQIDHIDRDKQNNRITNLREATPSANCQNRRIRADNSHGVVGVTMDSRSGRWRSRINQSGQTVTLGWFSTKEEAAAAYLAARDPQLA